MRTMLHGLTAVGLISFGYLLGASGTFGLGTLQAQEGQEALSQQTADQVRSAIEAVRSAQSQLVSANRYQPAIEGINSFAVTVGGVNAIEDLESGRGVDPETFAGLYAGLAVDEVAQHLGRDEQGRLTYKNRVVQLYPISRLEQFFARRVQLAEDGF